MHSYADSNNNNGSHLNGGGEQLLNGSSRYFSFSGQTNGSSGDASIDEVFSSNSGTASGSTSTLVSGEASVEQLLSGTHSSMDSLQQNTPPDHNATRNEYLLHGEQEPNSTQLSPLQTEKLTCESPKQIKSDNLPTIDYFS